MLLAMVFLVWAGPGRLALDSKLIVRTPPRPRLS
jgi:uncharacterized membrane protein YphA (DoxX/SURF4 family)